MSGMFQQGNGSTLIGANGSPVSASQIGTPAQGGQGGGNTGTAMQQGGGNGAAPSYGSSSFFAATVLGIPVWLWLVGAYCLYLAERKR